MFLRISNTSIAKLVLPFYVFNEKQANWSTGQE